MPVNPNLLVSKKQRQGGYYEQLALAYLQRQGLQLIAQNWQQPKVGEIDLIMLQSGRSWDTLVLVEVRKRKISAFGDALMSITPSKQRKLIKTAHYFLQQHPKYANFECRFDVVGFDGDDVAVGPKTIDGGIDVCNKEVNKADRVDKKSDTVRVVSEDSTTISSHLDSPKPHWVQGAFIASAW